MMDRVASGALLAAVPDGSHGARFDLAAAYRDHLRLVRWLVRSAGVPEHAVDDVTHDVFLAAHRRHDHAPHDESRRWMVGVTRSVCHSYQRGRARLRHRLAHVDAAEPAPTPEEALDGKATVECVRRALAQLLPEQRETYVLIELEGLSAPETAVALGVNVNTVYSRLRLARDKLRRELAASLELVARAREAGGPTREQSRRGWALLVAQIGIDGPVALGWAGGLAIGACLGMASLAAVIVARSPEVPPPREDVVAAGPSVPPPRVEHASPTPRPATNEPVPTIGAGAPNIEPAPTLDANAPTTRVERRPTITATVSAPRTPVESPHGAARTTPDHSLAAEAEVLRRAAAQLDAGQLDAGERLLDSHAQRYADGALAEERARLQRLLARLRKPDPP